MKETELIKKMKEMAENMVKENAINVINEIMEEFPFWQVIAMMQLMGVRWQINGEPVTPTMAMIRAEAKELLEEAVKAHLETPNEYFAYDNYDLVAECFADGEIILSYRPFQSTSFFMLPPKDDEKDKKINF